MTEFKPVLWVTVTLSETVTRQEGSSALRSTPKNLDP